MITLDQILSDAAARVETYAVTVADIPYERKGVLFSEMLFLRAALGTQLPARVIESGRARGQSTHLLAACLPECEILSVERDPKSPDVPVAGARLAGFGNVRLLFGDAMKLLPELVQEGDAVLIDGPKGYRALRLAFDILGRCRPCAVFIHDCGVGTHERDFLEQHLSETLYSDALPFVERFAYLDEPCRQIDPEVTRIGGAGGQSYGPTLACIPLDTKRDYGALRRRAQMRGMFVRVGSRLRRRFGGDQ